MIGKERREFRDKTLYLNSYPHVFPVNVYNGNDEHIVMSNKVLLFLFFFIRLSLSSK